MEKIVSLVVALTSRKCHCEESLAKSLRTSPWAPRLSPGEPSAER